MREKVLLGRAATVAEGQNPFVRQAAAGHDEAHLREQLARMKLDLGDHPARF
jgi:hypothetical protein